MPPNQIPEHYEPEQFPSEPPFVHASQSQAHKTTPSGRWLHTQVSMKDRIVVYGGVSSGTALLNDLWLYNGEQWLELEAPTLGTLVNVGNRKPGTPPPKDAGRPPSVPAPPPLRLAPGVKPPVASASLNTTSLGDVPLKTLEVEPVRTVEPLDPVAELQANAVGSNALPPAALLEERSTVRARQRVGATQRVGAGQRAGAGQRVGAQFLPGMSVAERQSTGTVGYKKLTPMDSDVWVYEIDDRIWTAVKAPAMAPLPRWLHSSVVLKQDMVVFGGVSRNMLLNDLWVYTPLTNTWKNVVPKRAPPNPRQGHSAVATATEKMTVFGGASYGETLFRDVWEYSGSWRVKKALNGPSGRWMHTALFVPGNGTFIHGGCGHLGVALNDLWLLATSGTKWTQVTPRGWGPSARWLHVSAPLLLEGAPGIFLTGGSSNNVPNEDMYFYSVGENTWIELRPDGASPLARSGATASVIGPSASDKKRRRRRRRRRLLSASTLRGAAGNALEAAAGTQRQAQQQQQLQQGRLLRRRAPPRTITDAFEGVQPAPAVGVPNPPRPTDFIAIFGGATEAGLIAGRQ